MTDSMKLDVLKGRKVRCRFCLVQDDRKCEIKKKTVRIKKPRRCLGYLQDPGAVSAAKLSLDQTQARSSGTRVRNTPKGAI